jgi:hypothetical protein
MKTLTVLCFMLIVSAPLKAEKTVEQYRTLIASNNQITVEETRFYVLGLGDGITWANAETHLFCQPGELSLGVDNYLDILDRQIGFDSARMGKDIVNKQWIGRVLLDGLKRTFPCQTKR